MSLDYPLLEDFTLEYAHTSLAFNLLVLDTLYTLYFKNIAE